MSYSVSSVVWTELTSWYSPSESTQPHWCRGTHLLSLSTWPASHWQPSTQVVGGRWHTMGKRSEQVGGQGLVQSEKWLFGGQGSAAGKAEGEVWFLLLKSTTSTFPLWLSVETYDRRCCSSSLWWLLHSDRPERRPRCCHTVSPACRHTRTCRRYSCPGKHRRVPRSGRAWRRQRELPHCTGLQISPLLLQCS